LQILKLNLKLTSLDSKKYEVRVLIRMNDQEIFVNGEYFSGSENFSQERNGLGRGTRNIDGAILGLESRKVGAGYGKSCGRLRLSQLTVGYRYSAQHLKGWPTYCVSPPVAKPSGARAEEDRGTAKLDSTELKPTVAKPHVAYLSAAVSLIAKTSEISQNSNIRAER